MRVNLATMAAALALSMTAVDALGQSEQAPPRLTFVGVAYDFDLKRDGFGLSTTGIRFLTNGTLLNSDVLGALRGSFATGGTIGVEFDPSQGDIDEKKLRAVFPALRILTAHEALRISRGPETGATPQRGLAEGVALTEARRNAAALPFIERALADPSLSPRIKSLAYRMRGELRSRAATDSADQPTLEGDRARVSGLRDLSRALELAPDDQETALQRSLILASLGADEEAIHGLRPMSDPERDYVRIFLVSATLVHMGRFAEALEVWDELAKHNPSNGLGMSYRYTRGTILIGLGRFEDASREFTSGLRQQPKYWPAYVGRACAWAKAGRLREAEKDYTEGRTLMLAEAPAKAGSRRAQQMQWMLQAGPKLESAMARSPNAPDDSPCMPTSHRQRSPLLDEGATAAAAQPTPAP